MRAITYSRYGPPEVLQLSDVRTPVPKDTEVLIRVRAAEATKADCEMRSFTFSVKWFWLPLRIAFGLRRPKRPILGGYFSGEIASVGKAVTTFSVGDRVYGTAGLRFGAYGEYVALPARNTIAPKPQEDDASVMTDPERQALYAWSRATLSPDALAQQTPAFSSADRAELIGVALMFHYTNRIVNVMLGDSPLPFPRIPGVKPLVMMMAKQTLRKLASQTVDRPEAARGPVSDQFSWARHDPVIHGSFCAFDYTAEAAGTNAMESAARQTVEHSIRQWRGESMPLDRGWVDHAVAGLSGVDRAAKLSLLTALDSRRVTKDDVLAYRSHARTDADLVTLLIWSSFQATNASGRGCEGWCLGEVFLSASRWRARRRSADVPGTG